jgi:hypothetical protein
MRQEVFAEITKTMARKRTRRSGLGLLVGGALSGLAARRTTSAAQEQIVELDIKVLTKNQIEGVLAKSEGGFGFGLQYAEGLADLAITASTGQELLAVEHTGGQIVTRIGGNKLVTSIPWAETQAILEVRKNATPAAALSGVSPAVGNNAAADPATVAAPPDASGTPLAGPMSGSMSPAGVLIEVFGDLSQALTVEGDIAAVDELRSDEAYALLPGLSFALAAAGLTGVSYPPSLALHALSLAAAADLETISEEPMVTYRIKLPEQLHPNVTFEDVMKLHRDGIIDCVPPGWVEIGDADVNICGGEKHEYCQSYPNRDDSCYGMCGWGCECWDGICGDCCYHDFCASHDDLMRHCSGTKNPVTCFTATLGAPLSFVTYGGCDGWLSLDWWPF